MKDRFRAVSMGATQDNLSLGKILSFDLPIPDLPTQNRIAGILSAYDDLIENNRRRITLLEKAARLIYREWFVDFRFPNHEKTEFENGLPVGWQQQTFGDLFEFLGGFAFESSSYTEGGNYGIVRSRMLWCRIHSRLSLTGRRHPKWLATLQIENGRRSPSTWYSEKGVVGDNYLLNQRVAKIEAG